ncbi:MAG: oxidoreductase [Candidatus Marinimicrobia bacterium]|nr:oxidoreductase [Candidatus Neomarinimicrobiota bacterium]
MDLGIKNKRAFVSGGATGIGKAIALELAAEGAAVVVSSREKRKVDEALKDLEKYGNSHYGITCDPTKEDGPQKIFSDIEKNFGGIDILVNNIGSNLGITDPYCPTSDWRKIFRINFEVAVELNNLFLPRMKKEEWGRVLNITSLAGLENSGPVTYCVTKAALTAYTRTMGRILATESKNVVMSALMPGVVITEEGYWRDILKENPDHAEKYLKERCPLGRLGETDEISPMAALMCSEQASFMHGAIVPVDAGQSKHFMYFNYLD